MGGVPLLVYAGYERYTPWYMPGMYPPVHPGMYTLVYIHPVHTWYTPSSRVHPAPQDRLVYSYRSDVQRVVEPWAQLGRNPWVGEPQSPQDLRCVTVGVPLRAELLRLS